MTASRETCGLALSGALLFGCVTVDEVGTPNGTFGGDADGAGGTSAELEPEPDGPCGEGGWSFLRVAGREQGNDWAQPSLASGCASAPHRLTAFAPRLGATLEIESGTNDPLAVFLVIILTEFILAGGHTPASELVMEFGLEAVLGAAFGLAGGFALVSMLNGLAMPGGLHPLFVVAGAVTISAVTSLVGELLQAAGKRVFVGGNLGEPLAAHADEPFDVVVLEVSSFQMERVESFEPAKLLRFYERDAHGEIVALERRAGETGPVHA